MCITCTALEKAVGEANSDISRKMLHKSVQILADDVVTVGRYENTFRDDFNKLEMAAQKNWINDYDYIQCPGRNVPDFLKLKYTDITKNVYIRS